VVVLRTFLVFATTLFEAFSILLVLMVVDEVAQNTVLSALAKAALSKELNHGET
jgi:hypothetical protein